jgi:hypothetical protein
VVVVVGMGLGCCLHTAIVVAKSSPPPSGTAVGRSKSMRDLGAIQNLMMKARDSRDRGALPALALLGAWETACRPG